ncbi:hypothetical protein RJI07_06355 [Mycoplasmatota bacterium WC30]
MKKKSVSKRILNGLLITFIVLISFVLIINIPIITLSNKTNDVDYSNWMSENLDDEQKVVDIAMLGAHDAFSNEINIFSELDPYESNSIMQGFTGVLIKGFIMRQSLTQVNDAEALLSSGVRYLDIRLTYDEENWLTKHNYISGEFEPIANQITDFLENNKGEFLILDFQHVSGVSYDVSEDYDTFYNMLNLYGLLDFAYTVNSLEDLTYGDLTNNGTESKVIIISKFQDSTGMILNYNSSIRSNWADSDDFEYIVDFLQEEADIVETAGIEYNFRVMQAVSTMQMSGPGILKALTTWSLIERAKDFNAFLLEYESFEELLEYLPIVMVDYSDTNYKEFNENIMKIIIDFN